MLHHYILHTGRTFPFREMKDVFSRICGKSPKLKLKIYIIIGVMRMWKMQIFECYFYVFTLGDIK